MNFALFLLLAVACIYDHNISCLADTDAAGQENMAEVKMALMEQEIQNLKSMLSTIVKQCQDTSKQQQVSFATLLTKQLVLESEMQVAKTKYQNLVIKQHVTDLKLQGHDTMIAKLDEKLPTYHQVVWTAINSGMDSGVLKSFAYTKKNANSGLKVTYVGGNRVVTSSGYMCSRWYFTFNDHECSNPTKIDSHILTRDPDGDMVRPTVVTGICYGIPQGAVKIGLHIGKCPHYVLGDGYTGHEVSLRILVEEVEGLQ